jgi:polysaccharide export outer membrane protein
VSIIAVLFSSCRSYKQNIMFKTDDDFVASTLSAEARALERNYTIQPNDRIKVEVYTKNGEMIIDPEYELNKSLGNQAQRRPDPDYLVRLDGNSLLPMIGDVHLQGLTLHESSLKLTQMYNEFFMDPYVIVQYTNKRVTVLGSPGGQILPLDNENISVTEVIAMAGGLQYGKAPNIKLIRGNEVFVIDFSTVDGYYSGNQIVQAGDIIYIEPIKRFLSENASEVALILSVITSLTTILLLFTQ